LCAGNIPSAWAQQAAIPVPREYQVKAVFMYNFGRFVTWPKSVYTGEGASIRICILGEDPFRIELDAAVKGEKVLGRALTVERLNNVESAVNCQILFISRSEKRRMGSYLRFLRQYPVLTVGDTDDFIVRGGMIQFYNLGNKIRFAIAPDLVSDVGLKVSSRLLRVARKTKGMRVNK
ncbi:MAG: YfiR family protein, partial [Gammaproteobacteria bacterium]|nr:YfiR family protein [Gammaproteobacteria bacterium]